MDATPFAAWTRRRLVLAAGRAGRSTIGGETRRVLSGTPSLRFSKALPALLLAAVAPGLLASVETEMAEAAFPGTNGKIIFVSNWKTPTNPIPSGESRPDFEIFAMNRDGTGIEQLTFDDSEDTYPAWSADGGWIAWTSYADGDGEIHMRSYGGNLIVLIRLTTNTADDSQPVFSPDGSKIAFRSNRDGNAEIYVMNTSDTNVDENGDNQINLTDNGAIDREPAWSPDGMKIAFTSNRDSNNYEIYVMDADPTTDDATNLTQLVNPAQDSEPDWSPDGSRIAFHSFRNNTLDIYVMNADGTEPTRLTKKAAGDYEPAWSPDGNKIAFKSYRGGDDSEIYVLNANKPESKKNRPKNLTKNGDVVNDYWPDWQPVQ